MKRTPTKPKGTKVPLYRWPGASPSAVRKGTVSNRARKMKVTLAQPGNKKT